MSDTRQFISDRLPTPIGDLLIVADDQGNLRATFWTDQEEDLRRVLRRHYPGRPVEFQPDRNPHGLTDAIARYFAGELNAIDALPVATAGTPFQREVWSALREIPCGMTISYGLLATRLGRPAAVRAVGLASSQAG
jgi:methylated-DNA-[protein]-cysteine S-methyltransferase